ncbi:carboxypeptidase regulatory-like domain-containing protein [Chryseobacterium polytrichastri]|uniref:Carboxypeptidase regulatory-like domain-containing protein n=1 Tax=Chryseobacterium polytrichastri TaxID=1302687 RepID=A0A1M7DCR2_9FLAO|nr:carboxypeptidase regulatory-like domain-containing protein [Chryseobacterium polytrichastri]SHL77157.1 Carboxypeptidase regulatory-like domain-containing protein [Chryseobacterium polytrichastri]
MRKHYLFILLCVFTLLTNCTGGEDPVIVSQNTVPAVVKTGKLTGKVMSQNGTKPIGGASVFTFDDKYKIYYTTSDADGNFTLEAPAGNQTIHIQTGNGSNFRTEISATVKDKETVSLEANQTKLNQVAKIAYVKGSYDKIEDIIQTLGYTATQITNNDLANLTTISQYDIIFLNCGSRNYALNQSLFPAIDANLATFVSNGGSIYASDWDVAYLVGGTDYTPSCSPAGGFVPDTKLCSVNQGTPGNVPAVVSNAGLSAALGFNSFNIDFDLGAWQKITNYDPNYWEVLVKDTSNNALMIRTNHFTATGVPSTPIGNAPTSTFVTVCITLPGNTQISISVPQVLVPFLVALGATVGPCTGASNSGYIYYTSFHNHASGNIGNAGVILQYVILNL